MTLPNGIVVNYGYDQASELTGLTYSLSGNVLGNLTYAYDADGRRAQMSGSWARTGMPNPTTSTAVYNAANELTNWNGATLTYDANGNMTSDGTNTYTWDTRNQLASIAGNFAASFGYDPFGRRLQKTINGSTTNFLYDGVNPVQELVGGSPSANLLTGLGVDEYFQRTDLAGTSDFLDDALGSTIALADPTAMVQTQYTYDPFGGTTAQGTGSENSFQFTGRENDGDGLYYYRARYYDPSLGRFVGQDPVGFSGGGPNLYAYTMDSPVIYIDPVGTDVFCTYCQDTGVLTCTETDASGSQNLFGDKHPSYTGYSGAPGYVNNPMFQGLSNAGPIPVGDYVIGVPTDEKGIYTMHLWPRGEAKEFNRPGLLMHGPGPEDQRGKYERSSEGCIVAPLDARRAIANAKGLKRLHVKTCGQ